MSKVVTIPNCRNPYVVIINSKTYSYNAGETVEVPDEVAEAIDVHMDAHAAAQAPQAAGYPNSSVLKRFELIGTIDFSTAEMAKAGAYVEYAVEGVSEILAVWNDMVNISTTNSSVILQVNGDFSYSINLGKTSKNGGVLNGYTKLTVYEGVGTAVETSAGAVAATNYSYMSAAGETSYNLLPLKEKINKMRVGNPATQYYAVGGILKIYAR
jgi:hypothetical protein